MLKNLDPLLTPELLGVLAAMGHGDELVVCDANFPADSVARTTTHRRPIWLPGTNAPRTVRAILSLLPLDSFVQSPALRMTLTGEPDALPEVQQEVQNAIDEAVGEKLPLGVLERFAFYDRARSAYAVVATGEPRLRGNFVFAKGLVFPEDA
jgi:L-fucose mutarotase